MSAAVTIYTRPFCGYCARAVSLLQRKNIPYTEIEDAAFDAAKKQEMIQKASGRTTFPQIFIDERHIGGCDDLMDLDRSGELDKLVGAA